MAHQVVVIMRKFCSVTSTRVKCVNKRIDRAIENMTEFAAELQITTFFCNSVKKRAVSNSPL